MVLKLHSYSSESQLQLLSIRRPVPLWKNEISGSAVTVSPQRPLRAIEGVEGAWVGADGEEAGQTAEDRQDEEARDRRRDHGRRREERGTVLFVFGHQFVPIPLST